MSGRRGSMTELTRLAALGSDQDIEEDTAPGEVEAMLRTGPFNLDRDFTWRNLEAVLNGTVSPIPRLSAIVLYQLLYVSPWLFSMMGLGCGSRDLITWQLFITFCDFIH